MGHWRIGVSAVLMGAVVSACGRTETVDLVSASECVEIPEGAYFQWVDGRLVGIQSVGEIEERPPETARRIGVTLAGMGYPWIVLNWDGQVATIGGAAPDELTRSDAFIAAKAAFEADRIAGPMQPRVINEITVRDASGTIATRLSERLASEGFDWLNVVMVGNAALLVGTASDAELKQSGYRRARELIDADSDASQIVSVIVDVIAMPGEDRPVGSALRALPEAPTLIDCENALFDTMAGRRIAFMQNQAIIDNSSARLLDAVSAIVQQCDAFVIEIGQHGGDPARASAALDLTQRQASAIRDYLSAYGADREGLIARGYGLTQPLDTSGSVDAAARNRRTAFSVRVPEQD